jgi:hypothetical protein
MQYSLRRSCRSPFVITPSSSKELQLCSATTKEEPIHQEGLWHGLGGLRCCMQVTTLQKTDTTKRSKSSQLQTGHRDQDIRKGFAILSRSGRVGTPPSVTAAVALSIALNREALSIAQRSLNIVLVRIRVCALVITAFVSSVHHQSSLTHVVVVARYLHDFQ